MPPLSATSTGKTYWRSLDDLAETPEFREFMHREFPAGASELLDSNDRRHFLKIMGASMALAGFGLTGCRRYPREKIVPYARRPEGRTPGVPVHFATSMEIGGVAAGLLATSYDGRPTKLEGNPEHPINAGASDALAQASVLNLYDPDCSMSPRHNGERSTWSEFRSWARDHFEQVANQRGRGLAFLTEATSSPTVERLREKIKDRFPQAEWYTYEPIHNDHERSGSILAFGESHRTHYHFDEAEIIVSLDSDFLLSHPAAVKHTRDYASRRRVNDDAKSMNRLYVCEGAFSLTGANADHRYPMRSADVPVVAARLAARLVENLPSAARSALARFDDVNVETPFIDQMVEDLRASRGSSAVIIGPNQPAGVHLLGHVINEALGNVGQTVRYTAQPNDAGHLESLRDLVSRIDEGFIETLVIVGGNPAYNAPADLEFARHLESMKEYGQIIHLSEHVDETSELATWHVNRAHYLESWGDSRAWDGTLCFTQPLIEPLFDGKSAVELLALIADEENDDGMAIVRRTLAEMTDAADVDRLWRRSLHDGFLRGSAFTTRRLSVRTTNVAEAVESLHESWRPAAEGEIEVIFARDQKVYDGRFANNGWLQELPEAMTKVTWDNALVINPGLGRQMNLKTGDVVKVTAGDRELEAPVMLLPGHHAGSATLAMGYGRRFAGRICTDAGVDAYQLRTSEAPNYVAARIEKTGRHYPLATTQDHYAIDDWPAGSGKQRRLPSIYREATLEEYRRKPNFVEKAEGLYVAHRLSQWNENLPFHSANNFEGAPYAWAMSIDLSACTGCSACIVACQAENNIPVVGKDQVRHSREMHWLRVDRYFRGGTEEQPEAIALQPVPCMHCENAPCEQVCPVAATIHDKEGLNVMVYNRCIGTRYCSNNCPYKVRRFNYFDFHRRRPVRESRIMHVDREYFRRPQASGETLHRMQFNPEVTVRSRGVMEKCTYCTQRINQAKIDAKNEWLKLPEAAKRETDRIKVEDGSFTTACAQACPAGAIVFGDLLDKESRISKLHAHERTYEMLEELNVKPRTRYMGKLRNPKQG